MKLKITDRKSSTCVRIAPTRGAFRMDSQSRMAPAARVGNPTAVDWSPYEVSTAWCTVHIGHWPRVGYTTRAHGDGRAMSHVRG